MSERKTNPFLKGKTIDFPYAIYKGDGPFGRTTVKVLKTYQHPEDEITNPYARWLNLRSSAVLPDCVAVSSDWTHGSYDMGDSYIHEAIMGLELVESTPEWQEWYGDKK